MTNLPRYSSGQSSCWLSVHSFLSYHNSVGSSPVSRVPGICFCTYFSTEYLDLVDKSESAFSPAGIYARPEKVGGGKQKKETLTF